MSRSDDSDLVGDVQGIVVGGEPDVGLLVAGGADQGVHLQVGQSLITSRMNQFYSLDKPVVYIRHCYCSMLTLETLISYSFLTADLI